jgi:Mechanosensitive ion channel, conserved TM helix
VSQFFDSLRSGLTEFFQWVPNLLGAIAILLIGYFLGKGIGALVRKALQKIGVDKLVEGGRGAEWRAKSWPGFSPSAIVGKIIFWFIFLIAILLALNALGIETLAGMISAIVAYLPNVVVAILILLVAFILAGGVAAVVRRTLGYSLFGRLVTAVAPAVIVSIAFFMALTQLKIATPIVVGTYLAVIASMGLGFALAFGLGGRKTAEEIIETAYEEGKKKTPQQAEGAATRTETSAPSESGETHLA